MQLGKKNWEKKKNMSSELLSTTLELKMIGVS